MHFCKTNYILRLDDACEKMDTDRWERMEEMLDKYSIKPLVGVIPHCQDPKMEKYDRDPHFYRKARGWKRKGWTIALHGYDHVYITQDGGLNPVNHKSEFAGVSLSVQKEKIRKGLEILHREGLYPQVFFAPSHTFDMNTLEALRTESNIRIISDTIAIDSYQEYGFTFVPQQSGQARRIPLQTVTFCYHPNVMSDNDFSALTAFMDRYNHKFIGFPLSIVIRKKSLLDSALEIIYFLRRK